MLSMAKQRNGGVLTRPHIPKQREAGGRIRFLSTAEEAQLLDPCRAWSKTDHADTITVLIDTGLRSSELWNLQAQDVDRTTGHLRIWTNKADHPRSVPMTGRVKAIMARRLPRVPSDKVFPYNNSWMDGMWNCIRHSMKLSADRQFVVYALRHTCASRLIQKGVSLSVIGTWLGHKSLMVTMRYAHLSPTNLTDAVKVLEVFDTDF